MAAWGEAPGFLKTKKKHSHLLTLMSIMSPESISFAAMPAPAVANANPSPAHKLRPLDKPSPHHSAAP